MALFGLFLPPCDYRAGAEVPHPHSLLQLWIDASDGMIAHDHAGELESLSGPDLGADWFDPTSDGAHAHGGMVSSRSPDLGDQRQSAPIVTGLHVLTAIAALLPELARTESPPVIRIHRLVGTPSRVLVPPPR